jgi:signal transduction histidine kinase/FixJ family two-component response regulator
MSSRANPSSGLPGANPAGPADWPVGGGEMGERIREFEWSQTAPGAVSAWPASLRAATSICLNSRFPMFIAWGTHRSMLYNDAYIAVLASKHPGALGRPAQEVWGEIWDILGPHWSDVFNKGEATWAEDLLLLMNRSGYDEETYFTFSYSPIRDEDGNVGGMFCACQETTEKVVGERRLKTLRELAAQATAAKSAQEACAMATKTLSGNRFDFPFSLLYLSSGDKRHVALAGAASLDAYGPASPSCVALEEQDPRGWPMGQVLREGVAQTVENLPDRLGPMPSGPWSHPISRALLLPIQLAAHEPPAGVLIAGVSPVRPLDEGYRTFLEVAAGQIASAITNARAYEQERHKAETLAELDRAKTAFFSNVSHEFRTPLTLMLGPVEELLLRSHTDLPPAAKHQLEVVNRNGLRLLRLVNTLLDFSRIEAGRVQAVFEPTDLAAFTGELASAFRAATEKAGLRLIVDCPRLPEAVYVDRDMWEKIVLNLVSNAFKFTFDGEIEVKIRAESGIALLTVRDTGVGVPTEEIPRLFERFHRVQSTRSRTYEGSGIGLALVQELVKLHSGSIRGESVLGSGTTFFVTVPLGGEHLPPDRLCGSRNLASTAVGAGPFVEEALRWLPEGPEVEETILPASNHELMPVPCPPGEVEHEAGRPRIIIADDNADMRQYLARLLRERYNVEAVPDGRAALAAARERTPDLILNDVMMPNLDGFGLVRELRADAALKTIPIVLLSARAGEESRVEGLQQGADDYLIKPFSARELVARVAAHLEMARLRREAAEQIRQSEDRYHKLFSTLMEGFCIVEVSFDANNRPVDYRFLEVNSAFEGQTGLHDAQGKLMRDLAPEHEAHWFEIYGKVALTGEPARFVNEARALGRWYDVSAYRVGGQDSRKVAILFNDITEIKRAAEALHESEARLRKVNAELSRHVAEQQAANAALRDARRAAVNLMKDSVASRERAEQTAAELRESEEALKKAHDELELRVRDRTSELSEAFERLRVENIQRKQLEDTLRQSEYQVRFFASQCLTAQETERKRIAGELHDSIAASLGAMKYRIDKIGEDMKQGLCGPDPLQDLGVKVAEINSEVRRIMADLRPSILDDLGITAAMKWFCREYQKTYSHISVENQIGLSEDEVPDSLKTPIFRICQEAMNNTAKYSKASLVNLSLTKEDAKIQLTIQDNGQGFDPETVRKGMGLSTMRERAELSGGSFELESTKGKGTTVRASWPI